MTVAVPAERLSLQASAAWSWLMEMAAAVAEALRGRRALSPAEAQLYAIAEELGAQILDAEDTVDLHARVYAIARDPRFIAWEVAIFRELDLSELPASTVVERSYATVLGPTHLAQECARLLSARIDVVAQLFAQGLVQLPDDDAAGEIGDAFADFRTPPALRSLAEETAAGEVALLALLAHLMDSDRWPCSPWLRLALLEQVRLASVSHLRLLSSVPGLVIPESVLPLDERLDPRALDREFRYLARQVLPDELPVGEAHVAHLWELIEGESPAPSGVRALFAE